MVYCTSACVSQSLTPISKGLKMSIRWWDALGSSKHSTTIPPSLPPREFNSVLGGLPDTSFVKEDRGSEGICPAQEIQSCWYSWWTKKCGLSSSGVKCPPLKPADDSQKRAPSRTKRALAFSSNKVSAPQGPHARADPNLREEPW